MLLVHGVLRDADRGVAERAEAGGLRPWTVSEGALAAVVSEAPDRELNADDGVAHLDLLVEIVSVVPVLPLALGTALDDEDTVRSELLAAQADELEGRLAAVADFVEVRLDLDFDTDASVAAVVAEDPGLRRLAERSTGPGSGLAERMALGETLAERVAELQMALAAEWTDDLVEIARRVVLLHSDEQLQRTAYLVRRDRLAEADDAVARLREQAEGRAAVEYVGPLPVYSFLQEASAVPAPEPTSRWGW